jgi:hypothetical protein
MGAERTCDGRASICIARCSQKAAGADHSVDVENVEFDEPGAMQEAALTRAEGERLVEYLWFWSF